MTEGIGRRASLDAVDAADLDDVDEDGGADAEGDPGLEARQDDQRHHAYLHPCKDQPMWAGVVEGKAKGW